MINLADEDGFSPFYLLCQKGYSRDSTSADCPAAAPQSTLTAFTNQFSINGAGKKHRNKKTEDYDRGL